MQLLSRTPPLPSSSSIASGGRWVSSNRDIDPYSVDLVRGLPTVSTFNEKALSFFPSPMSSPPRPHIHHQHHHHQQQPQQPHSHHHHSREPSGHGRPMSQGHLLGGAMNDLSRQPRNLSTQPPPHLPSLDGDRRLPPFGAADSRLGQLPSQHPAADGMGHTPFMMPRSIASPQGARRTKSHVASACVNCKKAHLACDVRRPCPRCVGLGKQDSCKDVQHKKRGRPRLREERHSFEVGNHNPHHEQGGPDAHLRNGPPPPGRPRGNSLSQGSRIVPYSMPNHGPPRYDPAPRPYYDDRPPPPRPNVVPPPLTSGTVLLNIHFVVARSTEGFQDMLGYGAHELTRVKSLYDLVSLTDRKKLYQLSTKLREDIDEREPAYARSISPSVYDMLHHITPSEIVDATRPFREIEEIIDLRRSDGRTIRTSARMSIGRTSQYFVVLVLSAVPDVQSPLQYRNSPSSPYPSHASKAGSSYAPSPSLHSLSPSLSSSQYAGPPIGVSQQQQQPLPPRPYTSHTDVTTASSPYHLYPPLQSINSASAGDRTPRTLQNEPSLPSLRQFTATSPATSASSATLVPRSPQRRSPPHEQSPTVGTPYESQPLQEPLKLPPLRGIPSAPPSQASNSSPRDSEGRGLGIRIPESAYEAGQKRQDDVDSQDGEPSRKRRRIGVAEMLD